ANNCRESLISKDNEFPPIIKQIMWKLIISYFKNLTYYLENDFLESTSNKIENFFQKILPQHIKKTFRSKSGVKARLELKTEFWNKNNLQKFNPIIFDSAKIIK
ncbi:MAG: transposase family protein, partial [Methanobacteriaceae archaeon]|nr:transposase family protein [Methanobacteriaceae archaeon]